MIRRDCRVRLQSCSMLAQSRREPYAGRYPLSGDDQTCAHRSRRDLLLTQNGPSNHAASWISVALARRQVLTPISTVFSGKRLDFRTTRPSKILAANSETVGFQDHSLRQAGRDQPSPRARGRQRSPTTAGIRERTSALRQTGDDRKISLLAGLSPNLRTSPI